MSWLARTVLAGFVCMNFAQAAAAVNVPSSFIPNRGQADPRVEFYATKPGATFWFTREEAVFSLMKDGRRADLALRFLDARPAMAMRGAKPMEGRVNYLVGNDPSRWRTDLPMYGELVYGNLWPGIDLVFRDDEGTLKYEFHVAAGADVSEIRLQYRGAERVARGSRGELIITTALGTITDARPLSYQIRRGKRVLIASEYVVGEDGRYGFAVGRYAANQPLVIDPGLAYSTFLGGSDIEFVTGMSVDSSGNAYVTGVTHSPDFPFTTAGPASVTKMFVTKFNPTGTAVIYSTLLGGTGGDGSEGIAVDAAGSAYIAGGTASSDFPTTANAYDSSYNGAGDAFLLKLNPAGNTILYSSYFGGSGTETATDLALDPSGIYLVGDSGLGEGISPDFPVTPGALYTGPLPFATFVAKFSTLGSLVYSTRLPFAAGGWWQIALDAAGNAYLAGPAGTGFATPGAYATTPKGDFDIGVAKLNAAGSQLVYATLIPGSGRLLCFGCNAEFDIAEDLAVDSAGNAYVVGSSPSPDFPSTAGSFDPVKRGGRQGFVTKLNATGSGLLYSTFVGPGSSTSFPVIFQSRGGGFPAAIALDTSGRAFLTGIAGGDLPTTTDAYDSTVNGSGDAFVAVLDPSGAALEYSTFLGGTARFETGSGIAVDGAGDVYVAGWTTSADFPTTPGAYDTSFNGGETDAFVAKLDLQLSVMFQALAVTTTAKGNSFEVKGTFTLGAASDGIDPVTEPVTVQIGDSSFEIPAGSFKRDKKGRYKFESKALEIVIGPLEARTYELKVDGRGIPAGNTGMVVLTIGNDKGSATSP